MALFVLGFFLIAPFVELWAVVAVAGQIGVGATLLALVLLSLSGIWLVKRQGLAVWQRANAEIAAGRVPTNQVIDAALILFGGLLLIVPGFITGAVGLLLMLPPVRALLRPAALSWMRRRHGLDAVMVGTTIGPDGTTRMWRSGGRGVTDARSRDSAGSYAEVIDVRVDDPDELGPSR